MDFHSLLDYDPETGIFAWKKVKPNRYVKTGDIAGTISAHGYRVIAIRGKLYRAARLAWFMVYGEWPNIIDHINRNRLDDRICNLRSVTQRENSANQARVKCPGVTWKSDRSKWRAMICYKGKQISLGQTADYFEACCLRKSAELNLT